MYVLRSCCVFFIFLLLLLRALWQYLSFESKWHDVRETWGGYPSVVVHCCVKHSTFMQQHRGSYLIFCGPYCS